jgi:two-component sensor histidine kinase
MSGRQTNPSSLYGRLPMREGHSPLGLYWGMPLVVLFALVGLAVMLWLPPDRRGILIAIATGLLLVAAAAYYALGQRRWERQTQLKRLLALDSLTALTASMGTEEGTEDRVFQQIQEAVRPLLGMTISCIGLLEDEGRALRIVAGSGVDPRLEGRSIPVADLPMTQQCISDKYVVAVSDTRRPDRPINSPLAREMNLRSMVQIPMIYRGNVLGVLVMGDSRPHAMTELDIHRASMWGNLAAVMISHGRLYRRMSQSLKEQTALMEHRDALFEMNTAIQRPGTLDEILNRIVNLAPATLEVDAAIIWLPADDNADELSMAAATPPYGQAVAGFRMPIGASRAGTVFNTGKAMIVENGPADLELNPDLKRRLPHGALVLEPLTRGDGKTMGVIVLMRGKVGAFRPDQLELARLLSLRAAAVIDMARLYQQTLSDAEAKAMLLRELNHRVKNNLTGIISLLSIHPPPLSRDARRWLDRAIGRIEAMAQAHDLFSIGSRRVTLAELVERTVRSMSVVKPAGVTIKTDLAAGRAMLRTDRAVSLAMAMHELCFNGLVHGLRDKGTLTIRARRENGHLAVEVEDDAGRPPTLPIEPLNGTAERSGSEGGHSGIGLSLVRGLVGRELRGQFTLAPAGGGARATLQFPLLADELSDGTL